MNKCKYCQNSDTDYICELCRYKQDFFSIDFSQVIRNIDKSKLCDKCIKEIDYIIKPIANYK